MSKQRRILIIIPCMNEGGRIGPVVRSVMQEMPDCDIVVVDDDSSDASAEEAAAGGARVLSLPCNQGYGAALETGYLHAMRHGYELLLQMDGDGQHVAAELPKLLEPVRSGACDLVIGSRYGKDEVPAATSPMRRMGHRLFGLLIYLLTRRRFSDPTSGFQAMNRRAFSLLASGVFPCDYPDSDILLMAHLAGLRIQEVPVRMLGRDGGVSMHTGLFKPVTYGVKMLFSIFIVLLNIHTWRRWARRNKDSQP